MAQTYTHPVARERMADGLCPECGHSGDDHTGWGLGSCTLTDLGVAERIHAYQQQEVSSGSDV